MPAGLIPNEGLAVTLRELLGAVPPSVLPWQMLLWVNDYVPTAAATLDDLQEAGFQGYARQVLSRDLWSVPTVAAGCAHSTWGVEPIVWTVTGGPVETVYGYAYVDPGESVLRFIQRFDPADVTPIIVPGRVLLLPEYTLTSAECV